MNWKRCAALCLLSSIVVMVLLPWGATAFLPGDAGMAACLVLFFAVNPAHSLAMGLAASTDCKKLWGIPVLSAAFFLGGVWAFLDGGEAAFIYYAIGYLLLGMAAMAITTFRKRWG